MPTSGSTPKFSTSNEDERSFDDCLRLLVNTPPKPKKAEAEAHPKKAQAKPKK
jgi:hypothetical protein